MEWLGSMVAEVNAAMTSRAQSLCVSHCVMSAASKWDDMVHLKVWRTVTHSQERSSVLAAFALATRSLKYFNNNVGISNKRRGLDLDLAGHRARRFESLSPSSLR